MVQGKSQILMNTISQCFQISYDSGWQLTSADVHSRQLLPNSALRAGVVLQKVWASFWSFRVTRFWFWCQVWVLCAFKLQLWANWLKPFDFEEAANGSPVHLVFVLLVGHGSHVMRSDGSSLNRRGRRRGRRRRKRLNQNWKSLQIHRLGHQGVEVHRGQLVKVKVKVGPTPNLQGSVWKLVSCRLYPPHKSLTFLVTTALGESPGRIFSPVSTIMALTPLLLAWSSWLLWCWSWLSCFWRVAVISLSPVGSCWMLAWQVGRFCITNTLPIGDILLLGAFFDVRVFLQLISPDFFFFPIGTSPVGR